MRTKFTALFLAAVLALTGCANPNMTPTEQRTATGAGIGAVAGAIIGHQSGRALEGAAIGAVVGGVGGYAWSRHMEQQRASMQQAAQGTGIVVTRTSDNRLKLDIPSDISFQSGRSDISPRFAAFLDRFAANLNTYPSTLVAIVGHTDNSGSDAVNLPLSRDRAMSTRDYLINRGVAPNRFAIDGRSSYEPIAPNTTATGRKRNRRVEIYVYER